MRCFFFIPLFLPLFQPQTHKRKSYHLLYFVLAFPFVWNFSSTTRYLHNLSRPTLSFCLNIFILMRPSLVTNLKSSLACTPPLCLSPSSPAPSNLLYSLLNYFDVGLSLCSEWPSQHKHWNISSVDKGMFMLVSSLLSTARPRQSLNSHLWHELART